jgi:hypothetical protein
LLSNVFHCLFVCLFDCLTCLSICPSIRGAKVINYNKLLNKNEQIVL